MAEPFLLGVNYWPRRKAMYWWSHFDPVEVADEFDVIAGLGLDLVRIFLLWEDFQPTPSEVSRERLTDLGVVADLAEDRGLGLDVTFFVGHMSGPNWLPGWLLDVTAPYPATERRQVVSGGRVVASSYLNPFTHPDALTAERLLLRQVVGAYRDHPAIRLWNLGNEPDLLARPPRSSDGRGWVAGMVSLVHELDPDHPVTCGLHAQSLVEDNGFRVDQIFAETDIAVMHGYPMYAEWATQPLDPDFVPFLCALTAALSGKPVLAEEWGGCTAPPGEPSRIWEWDCYGRPRAQFMAGEEDLADHVAQVLPRLVEVGATGAVLWCFADYAPQLWDRPPCEQSGARHERHFGLVRCDGSLKPHAEVLSRFAAARPAVARDVASVRLPLSPEEYYRDPGGMARRLYASFRSGGRVTQQAG